MIIKKRILLLEPYICISHLFYFELKLRNIECIEALTYNEAVEIFLKGKNNYDYIITEYQLNKKTGFDFLDFIYAINSNIGFIIFDDVLKTFVDDVKKVRQYTYKIIRKDLEIFDKIEKIIKEK